MSNVAKDLFKAAKLITIGLTVYFGSVYVIWYHAILPIMLKYGTDYAVYRAWGAQFDEVISSVIIAHAAFCLTRIGAKK